MANPWLKKNPLLSMWLSTANRVVGTLRGQAAAQVKRQATTAVTEATRAVLKQGTAAAKRPAPRTKPARKRR